MKKNTMAALYMMLLLSVHLFAQKEVTSQSIKRMQTQINGTTELGNSGQKLTLRKHHIYNGVNKLSNNDLKMTFADQPELYFKYKKARHSFWKLWNFIGAYASGLLCGGIFDQTACNNIGDVDKATAEEVLVTFAGIGVGLYSGYLIHRNINHRKLQNIVNQYNTSLPQSYVEPKKSTTVDLSLIPTSNGLGLRLSF